MTHTRSSIIAAVNRAIDRVGKKGGSPARAAKDSVKDYEEQLLRAALEADSGGSAASSSAIEASIRTLWERKPLPPTVLEKSTQVDGLRELIRAITPRDTPLEQAIADRVSP